MASKVGWLWQKMQQHPFIVIGIIVLLITFLTFALAVHWWGWDWTGFNGGYHKISIATDTKPSPQKTTQTEEQQPAKTFWDWLLLLAAVAIPVVVGFGAAWFTAQHSKVSERENKDNQREKALQDYIDKMSELLLDKDNPLRESKPEDEVRTIAQARTLTVLRGLDGVRKGSILQFLYGSRLIDMDKRLNQLLEPNSTSFCSECGKPLTKFPGLEQQAGLQDAELSKASMAGLFLAGGYCDECGAYCFGPEDMISIVDLRGADLRGADLREAKLYIVFLQETDLRAANLDGANLGGANLYRADLRGADLREAKLYAAFLEKADLWEAKLRRAFLQKAKLCGAFLRKAELWEADLQEADLRAANLSKADLRAANLEGADLSAAHLVEANLAGVNLVKANLAGADLSGADLSGADLSGADLGGANLSGADLKGAIIGVTIKELEKQAASLKGATMPDGSTHP